MWLHQHLCQWKSSGLTGGIITLCGVELRDSLRRLSFNSEFTEMTRKLRSNVAMIIIFSTLVKKSC